MRCIAEHQDPPNSPDFHKQIPHSWESVMKWVHVVSPAHLDNSWQKGHLQVRGKQMLSLPGFPAFGAGLFLGAHFQEAQMGSVQREFSSTAIHLCRSVQLMPSSEVP